MMAKRKLMFFQPFIGPYRVDFTNDLSDAFDARIYLKLPNSESEAFHQKDIARHLRYTPIQLPTRSKTALLRYLRNEIKHFQPDIVITFEYDLITLFILVYRWLTRGNFRVVGMSDDSYDMLTGNAFTWRHDVARRLLAKYLDEIILVEPKAVDWYRQRHGKGFFFPIIRDEKVVRQMYGDAIPLIEETRGSYHLSGQFIFLFVGRLASVKNLSTLIEAYSGLDVTKDKLVIVGDGPEKEPLQRQSKDLGLDVLFVGRQDGQDLHVWYQLANTFVLPSIREPFGAVTNEALIGGCCAIVSERAGSKCLIDEGKNGFIFDPTSVEDLRAKLSLSKGLPQTVSDGHYLRESKMTLQYGQLFQGLCDMLYSI